MRFLVFAPGPQYQQQQNSTAIVIQSRVPAAFPLEDIYRTGSQKYDYNQREHSLDHHQSLSYARQRNSISGAERCSPSESQKEIIKKEWSPAPIVTVALLWKIKVRRLMTCLVEFQRAAPIDFPVSKRENKHIEAPKHFRRAEQVPELPIPRQSNN